MYTLQGSLTAEVSKNFKENLKKQDELLLASYYDVEQLDDWTFTR